MALAYSSIVVTEVSDLEHAVAQIPDLDLLQASGLVLRLSAELWLSLMSEDDSDGLGRLLAEQSRAVVRRAPNIDVFAVQDGHSSATARPAYVARHAPRLLFGDSPAGRVFRSVDTATLKALRQDDLAQHVERARARCVICASANYHFALPSGAHSSQFLRLAEAFTDMVTIDRIAYWIALEIESSIQPLASSGRHALLVDHPSMLVLAARVQVLVSVQLEVVTLSTYPSDIEARTATFLALEQVSARCPSVHVLIGVASTGRLARFIHRWAQGIPQVQVRTMLLYSVRELGDAESMCRLDLPGYKHYPTRESCELCAGQSEAVAIQASNYLVGFAPAESVALPPKYFSQQRTFLERWGAVAGVLRTHYDDPNESTARHHAFYVDVGTLLEQEEFQAELLEAVGELEPKPEVVVVPDHPTALRIGELLAEATGLPAIVLDSNLLAKGTGATDQALLAAKCVLVVDDVFITGSRLDVINRFLREHRSTRVPAVEELHFMTLLATPASDAKYAQRMSGLTGKHGWNSRLTHLYRFTLPDWHLVEGCPWCREHAVLSRLARLAGELDGPLADRIASLANKVDGLTSDAFFLADGQLALPPLGAESVVLREGATPLQVLFACASAVQQLRHAESKPLNAAQFPAPAYLASRVMETNFTERVIWLALLRCLRSSELSPELRRFLRGVGLCRKDAQHALLHAEFVVAWLTGKLDALDSSDEGRLLFEAVGIPWEALFEAAFVDRQP